MPGIMNDIFEKKVVNTGVTWRTFQSQTQSKKVIPKKILIFLQKIML